MRIRERLFGIMQSILSCPKLLLSLGNLRCAFRRFTLHLCSHRTVLD